MLDVSRDPAPSWLKGHPHLQGRSKPPNVIYIADGPGGGGVFDKFHGGLQLTAEGTTRSLWRLPACFSPHKEHTLSYHEKPERWERHRNYVLLSAVGRGQEFVLDCDHFPEAPEWVRNSIGSKA